MKVYTVFISLIIVALLILFQLEYTRPFISTNVINLDRSPERLYCTSIQLFLNTVPFNRYTAIDGKSYVFTQDELNMFSGLIEDRKDKISEQKLKNVMSCALSHINIWKRNVGNGPILILEDDLIIYPRFKYHVNHIIYTMDNLDPNWHIIWVSGGDPGDREVVATIGAREIYRMDPPEYIGQGTVGYILSKRGLEYFVDNLNKNGCSAGIDIHLLKTLDTDHAYGVNSSLIGTGLFTSSITN
jgi:GR25 family glycosyltransferase involved in LPS biosynthesis